MFNCVFYAEFFKFFMLYSLPFFDVLYASVSVFGVSCFLLFPNRRKRVITSLEVDFSTKQANQIKLNCVIAR